MSTDLLLSAHVKSQGNPHPPTSVGDLPGSLSRRAQHSQGSRPAVGLRGHGPYHSGQCLTLWQEGQSTSVAEWPGSHGKVQVTRLRAGCSPEFPLRGMGNVPSPRASCGTGPAAPGWRRGCEPADLGRGHRAAGSDLTQRSWLLFPKRQFPVSCSHSKPGVKS